MIRLKYCNYCEIEFRKAAFIQVRSRDTLEDIDEDLRLLETKDFKYVFIDEVTLMEDFIEGAALFSDIYASSGMNDSWTHAGILEAVRKLELKIPVNDNTGGS